MEEKAKNTPKKKPWKPMEMAKVPLNQDQAVLTCCSQPARGVIMSNYQCETEEDPDCGPSAFSQSS